MKRFAAWLYKEWRDQRAIVTGIFIAVPALTGLAYWAFGDRIGEARLESVRAIFLGIAIGLVTFAVASDLVAGESRRGTIRALRRLPRALGTAFAAKLTFLVLIVVLIVAWQGLSLSVAEALNSDKVSSVYPGSRVHENGAVRAMVLCTQLGQFPGGALWLNGLGFGVLCLWTFLTSTWLGRSGVAGAAAIALLAALATPFFLFFRAHPYFFPGPVPLAAGSAGVAALVALLAAGFSVLKGHRFHGRPLRPFLLGAAVLIVSVGGGYAYASKALDDYLDIDPRADDFRIHEARAGQGLSHLFLTVHRGQAWFGDNPMGNRDRTSAKRGSPLQAWVVDLETGVHRRAHEGANRYFLDVPELNAYFADQPLDPSPAYVCYHVGGEGETTLSWWDAVSGEKVRTLPSGVRDPITMDLVHRTLEQAAWLRDAQGRRVWVRDGILEREGEVEAPLAGIRPRTPRTRRLRAVIGGFVGSRYAKGSAPSPWVFVDLETGEEREVGAGGKGRFFWPWHILSSKHLLAPTRVSDESGKSRTRQRVVRLDDPESTLEPVNAPDLYGHVIDRNLVLSLRRVEGSGCTVHAWNPLTGEDRPLRWTGEDPGPVGQAIPRGRTGDGRILIWVSAATLYNQCAWAVLHPDRERLTLLTPWHASTTTDPVALLEDDSLIVLERRKRVVRYAPGKAPETLFPR